MKPADRSLDIAVLGLGQAGGNIAAEFHRRGYRALAFNNAKTDLDSLAPRAARGAAHLHRTRGLRRRAGSDVEDGRECIAAHAERIRAAVAEHAASADVVVVAAGLGNGIGSCAPELARAAARPGPAGRGVHRAAPPLRERHRQGERALRDSRHRPESAVRLGADRQREARAAPPRPSDQRLLRDDQPRHRRAARRVQPAERPRVRPRRSACSAARTCARCCSAAASSTTTRASCRSSTPRTCSRRCARRWPTTRSCRADPSSRTSPISGS